MKRARFFTWRWVAAVGFLISLAGGDVSASSVELLMLERPGCVYCARWNKEIAPAYSNSWEGRVAPLRRVDLTEPWPDDLQEISTDVYTPTFILTVDGVEIARLRGYPGDNFFWPLLDEMFEKMHGQ